MLVAAQISSLLFHVGVTLAILIPRLPNDRPFPFSIGGDLSYNFRRVMLALVTSNVVRMLFLEDSRFKDGSSASSLFLRLNMFIALRALESFLLSFLCLLTPYLMQCQLQNRINISHPGRDLMIWVYLVVLISAAACLLVEATGDSSYWCLKKLADALTFPPIYHTLKLYNSITTPGGRYPGRGDMSVQTLLTMEYLVLVSTVLAAIGYWRIKDPSPVYEAFRHLGAYVQLTRLFCHATLMNARDEADYFAKFTTTATDEPDGRYETPTKPSTTTTLAKMEVLRSV